MISENTNKFLHMWLVIYIVLVFIIVEIFAIFLNKYFILINGNLLLFIFAFYYIVDRYIYYISSSYEYNIQDDKIENKYSIFCINVANAISTKDLYKIKFKTNILTFKYNIVSIILYNSSGSLKLDYLDKNIAQKVYIDLLEVLKI